MDARVYRFGEFVLDPRQYELRRGAARIYLQPKTFDLLHYLLQHADRVVSKDHRRPAFGLLKRAQNRVFSSPHPE